MRTALSSTASASPYLHAISISRDEPLPRTTCTLARSPSLEIILVAELLVPKLRPKYRVAIEKQVYQTTGEESLLVGIPDVVVGRSASGSASQTISSVAVALPPVKPVTVTIPMPEEVREGYLEVREVGTVESRDCDRGSLTPE